MPVMSAGTIRVNASRRAQGGAFLLEALIAVLIVALGILGVVGLQARSMKAVGDAQYRGEAAFYAQTLAGRVWAHDPTDIQNYFDTGKTGFTSWSDQVTDTTTGLPGAAANPPTIVWTQLDSGNGMMAQLTISWQAPGDTAVHQYVSQIVVGSNQS
jgi:type IV pilus assembly protein PilV